MAIELTQINATRKDPVTNLLYCRWQYDQSQLALLPESILAYSRRKQLFGEVSRITAFYPPTIDNSLCPFLYNYLPVAVIIFVVLVYINPHKFGAVNEYSTITAELLERFRKRDIPQLGTFEEGILRYYFHSILYYKFLYSATTKDFKFNNLHTTWDDKFLEFFAFGKSTSLYYLKG